jgi:hypothetical protein
MDTSPESCKKMLEILRALTPEDRARMTFERIEAAREFRKRTEHLRQGCPTSDSTDTVRHRATESED